MKKITSVLSLSILALLFLPRIIIADEVEIQVVVQKANIRAKADLNSEVIGQVSIGTVLKSDLKEGNWYRITLPPDEEGEQRIAYIHSSLVEEITQEKQIGQVQPEKPEKTVQEKVQPETKKEQPIRQVQSVQRKRIKNPSEGGNEYGLRFSGGGSFFLFGRNDFNRYAQSSTDYYNLVASMNPAVNFSIDFKEMITGMNFGGEFFYNFSPSIGIGVGVGMIQAGGKESSISAEEAGNSIELTMTPKISAIPILITAYFGIPIGNIMEFVVHAGGGLYLGTVQYDNYIYFSSMGMWAQEERTWEAKSNTFGFHGGLGFAFHLSHFLDLVLDVSGRSVEFQNLTADTDWTVKSNIAPQESGTNNGTTLWYFEEEISGTWYPKVELRDEKPNFSGIRNVEEAVVGLSGLALQFGIKLKLNRLFKR